MKMMNWHLQFSRNWNISELHLRIILSENEIFINADSNDVINMVINILYTTHLLLYKS